MENSSHEELLEAQSQIWRWTLSHLVSMSIKCAIHLRIPDAVHKHGQPAASLSELISALRIPPSKTHAFRCMMRVLSTRSTAFFSLHTQQQEQEEEEMYALTPASRLLLSHEPLNQASLPLLNFHPASRDYCSVLNTWLLEDDDHDGNIDNNNKRTAFEVVNGTSFWDYVAGSSAPGQELKGLFYDCMVSDSKLVADALVSSAAGVNKEEEEESPLTSLLFRGVRTLVDVAGGTGVFAAAVAGAFPEMKCVVLDLPHVVEGLAAAAAGPGHRENLEFVAGDMFERVPHADAIFLKWILHNWDDESCVKILKCCKEAAVSGGDDDEGKKGKVIIVDIVMSEVGSADDDLSREIQLCFDLMMATMVNGKERNEREWKKLFEAAGYSSYKIVGKIGPRSIIEVYP
ncbi:unnamed protein product [Linum tenue]|uniref:Uncharacterized protein n=1 Tax=Linum tenue TaxID=586396 RepID=A0AAV0JB55_9ROSI|nr:unnamed protein product [Linum tenue]